MSKRYKVVGTQEVLDHHPGETFVAEITPGQEDFLVQIGAIKAVGGPMPDDDKDASAPADRK